MQFDKDEQIMSFTDTEQQLLDCALYEDIDLLLSLYLKAIEVRENNMVTIRAASQPTLHSKELRKRLLRQNIILSGVITESQEIGRTYLPELFTDEMPT